jgi:uncharacterized protein
VWFGVQRARDLVLWRRPLVSAQRNEKTAMDVAWWGATPATADPSGASASSSNSSSSNNNYASGGDAAAAASAACDASPPDWLRVVTLVQFHGPEAVAARTPATRRSLLHVAAAHGKADYVHLLVARGADVAARDLTLWTPLLEAAANGHDALIAPLARYGADVNAGNVEKHTALHYASSMGHARTVVELLRAGAHVHVRNPDGRAPLHAAAEAGSFAVARALLMGGADRAACDLDGETPAMAAERYGHAALSRFLREEQGETELPGDHEAADSSNNDHDGNHSQSTDPGSDQDALQQHQQEQNETELAPQDDYLGSCDTDDSDDTGIVRYSGQRQIPMAANMRDNSFDLDSASDVELYEYEVDTDHAVEQDNQG